MIIPSMAQILPLLLLWSFSFLFTSGVYSAKNFTLMNNCNHTVWPALSSNAGATDIPTTGFVLQNGESKNIQVPDSSTGRFWAIWGRTYCSENSNKNFSCVTGDCGSGKLECSNFSSPRTTSVELSLNAFNDVDFYDVSVVGGYNLPVAVAPLSGTNCTSIVCSINLNDTCPSELKVLSSEGEVVACQNTCEVLKQEKFCNKRTLYSDVFKKACPTAYSYALDDDATKTYTCAAGGGYAITFCPSRTDSTTSANIPLIPTPAPTATPYSPSPPPNPGNGGLPIRVIVSVVVLIIFALIFRTLTICFLMRKAKKKHNFAMEATGDADENKISEVESLQYDLSSIRAATNNFSADNKIGEGGFGEVFKGTLNNGKQVAVKRLSKKSGQGEEAFKNEVQVVAKLQHRNLVRLLGYCLEKEEKLLIFEYVPNGSLDAILFDDSKQYSMDWSRRYKIIGGIARGILYLHEDSRLRIIHRDIKASNVLLDKDMNAKISDFGLAKIVGFDESQGNTSRVVGTFGYMSPEYVMNGQFSIKSDVFSFGVLLLEIISGKKNNSLYQSSDHILSHAWKLWKEEKPFDLVDPALGDFFNRSEVTRCIHIGLLCVQDNLNERPTMASVVLMLNNYSMILPIPHEPAFFLQGGMLPMSNQSEAVICSANGVTISELFPR